jgi:methylated-DNA-[protein]-cysteine S-methyltransferase
MTARGFSLFDTPIGACGMAWGDASIAAILLPDRDEEATRARLARRFPEAREALPPNFARAAQAAIAALLRGERSDLAAIPLDMTDVPDFDRRVYEIARTIAPGATLTYGEIAAHLAAPPEAARDVGRALARNPFSIVVPCHRVVAAGGKTGGFSARGGVETKLRLLAIERAHAASALPLFDRS